MTSQLGLRIAVAATVLLAPLLYTRASHEAFAVVELTVVLLGAIAVASVGGAAVLAVARIRLPRDSVAAGGIVLLVAFSLAAAAADRPLAAVRGSEGRSSGLLLYVGCLVVFAGTLFLHPPLQGAKVVLSALLAGGSVMSVVAALQWAGWDLLGAEAQLGTRMVGTLGNANFASAYIGLTVPVALSRVISRDSTRWVRGAAGVVTALAFVTCLASDSVQGPIAALAGASVVALALTRTASERIRRISAAGWTAAALSSAGLVGLGLQGFGPLSGLLSSSTFTFRKYYWSAAARLGWDHPWLGVGIDRFGGYYRQYRSDAATARLGSNNFVDAAHNVPLQMWANGGIILTGAYLAFVGVVAWHLVRGLARLRDREHLLVLGGAGGAWVAYQVQSLVSIDQPPLALVHFVTAGLVVILSHDLQWRQVHLAALSPRRGGGPARVGSAIAAVVLGLGACYVALSPLRSNLSLHKGNLAVARGDAAAALAAFDDADAQLLSGSTPRYRSSLVLEQVGELERAIDGFRAAIAKDPRVVSYRIKLALLLVDAARWNEAEVQLRRAVILDPRGAATLTDAGSMLLAMGKDHVAVVLLERAVAIPDATTRAFGSLGDALRRVGRDDDAFKAYARAIELDPANKAAREALDELMGGV